MIKTVNVSSRELDDVLIKLWEKCEEDGMFCSFMLLPREKKIEFYQTTEQGACGKMIAVINVVDVHDSFDVVREIFNKN